jgi:nucleotide-binding universal stress UspA family protein
MKNVLLFVHDDAGQEARLQAALDLTRAIDGHLTCLNVLPVHVPVVDLAGYIGEAMIFEDEARREEKNRHALHARLSSECVRWSMAEAAGEFAVCLDQAAGLADIIVLNTKLADAIAPDMRSLVTSTVAGTRKPVLAVPEKARGIDLTGKALVAWDGSLPAMAALSAATPLLRLAETVDLVHVRGSSKADPGEAAAYLSRHDIHVNVEFLEPLDGAPNKPDLALRGACLTRGYSCCVMGAYGHSVVRETLFGGVTRRMLMSSETPLLLAH